MAQKFKASTESIKELISNPEDVKKGFPSVYKLVTKDQITDSLRRVTFGKKDKRKPNKTILLVGETGAGKTSLVNTLVNYCLGVTFEDGVWFQIIEEPDKEEEDQIRPAESQTSDVIVYEVFGFEGQTLPFSLTIIDTPGFGSTQSVVKDLIVSQKLFDLFRSESVVHELDAVGLVLKSSDNRLSDRLMYIFDSVMSLFGNDMSQNIIALITHSNGTRPDGSLTALKAAEIKCARNEQNEPLYFLFDNCQHSERTDKTIELLKNVDKISRTGIEGLSSFLEKTKSQKIALMVEVLNERIRLVACLQNLQERIKLLEMKENEIQQTERALKDHERVMKMNKDFTVEVDEPYKVKEPIEGRRRMLFFFKGAVCCTHCEENCHYPGCTLAWSPERCEVMVKGNCTVCSRKCLASAHVKENWIYVPKTRKVKKTEEDLKKEYEINKAASTEAQSLLDSLQKEKQNLEEDKKKWLSEAYEHAEKLNKIALKAQTVSTHVCLEFLIEKMEKYDAEKSKKLKQMAQSVDKVFKRALNYASGAFRSILRGNQEEIFDIGV